MIDSHLHVSPNFSLQSLINYLDDEGIDACWLLTWEESPQVLWPHIPLTVESVYEAYQQYPQRIIPMYAPDPLQANCLEKFRRYHQLGFSGCAELKTAINWRNPALTPLLTYLNEHRLPLVIHMEEGREDYLFKTSSALDNFLGKAFRTPRWGRMSGRVLEKMAEQWSWLNLRREKLRYDFPGYMMDMAEFEIILQQFPHIKFVGHGPYFWQCIADTPGSNPYPQGPIERPGVIWHLLATYDNLFADISGQSGYCALSRDPKTAARFLDTFANKLLYGTDNYFVGLKPFLDGLSLNAAVYRQIYDDNARSLIETALPANADS